MYMSYMAPHDRAGVMGKMVAWNTHHNTSQDYAYLTVYL